MVDNERNPCDSNPYLHKRKYGTLCRSETNKYEAESYAERKVKDSFFWKARNDNMDNELMEILNILNV